MVKNYFLMLTMVLVLSSCSQTIYLACSEPDIEVYVNEQNYGRPPVQVVVTSDVQYLNVSFRRNGYELHSQRVYIVNGQNFHNKTNDRCNGSRCCLLYIFTHILS